MASIVAKKSMKTFKMNPAIFTGTKSFRVELLNNLKDYLEKISKPPGELEKAEPKGIFIENLPVGQCVVMDTSIAGIRGMIDVLKAQKEVVVLDDVIRELKGIKDFYNKSKSGADKILKELAMGNKPFIFAYAREKRHFTDDTILDYCYLNREKVILFTADKEMAALARCRNIRVMYFERKPIAKECIPKIEEEKETQRKIDLENGFYEEKCDAISQYDGIWFEKGKLYLKLLDVKQKKFMAVCSKSNYYRTGTICLKVNDDILIARNKEYYYSLSHYKVINLGKNNNTKLVYIARLKDATQLELLPNARYISLMRDFIASCQAKKK